MQLQVTLINPSGKYKPVSTLVEIPIKDVLAKNYTPYKTKGIEKICLKKRWYADDLKKLGYTKVKVRVYDKQKIEEENKARYEKIKKERGWA